MRLHAKLLLTFLITLLMTLHFFEILPLMKTIHFCVVLILIAVQSFVLLLLVYQVIIGSWGTILSLFSKNDPAFTNIKNRFAILVCAHNEEMVIEQIIQNLKSLNYPTSHYDIYVICDNCTDSTVSRVKENNVFAFERINCKKKGKGFALEWMFDQFWAMEEQGNSYDAFLVLDADNLVSSNFLQVADQKLQEGHEVIQGYLDSKNPSDTWITKSYAFSYWSTNRVYQLGRCCMGLSAQLGGTGMVFKKEIIREMGWGATSLTEDLEFTMRYALETNRVVCWAKDAKVYDEKPQKLMASVRQRIRWMSGHVSCMYKYSWTLLSATFNRRSFKYFDLLIYVVQPPRVIINGIGLVFIFASYLNIIPNFVAPYILGDSVWLFVLIPLYLQTIVGAILESKAKHALWAIYVYAFGFTWIPATMIGWFRRKNSTWVHTKHHRIATKDEIKELTKTNVES